MSYCKYENTYNNLLQIKEEQNVENHREERYKVRLINLMIEMLENEGFKIEE